MLAKSWEGICRRVLQVEQHVLRPLREGWLVPETERMAVWLKVYKGREIQDEI